MRNLTIKREKSIVGCIGKMKVYIEDCEAGELTINGVPCRKIGELKNGEEKTFEISERSAKVCMIADKLSKEYCNEFYQLSEGNENIYLSGKNKFNPASGNAFRFDNNNSEGVSANRKKGTLKGILVLIVALAVGFGVGFGVTSLLFPESKAAQPKTFTCDGMSITLTDEFSEIEAETFTVAYGSKEVAAFILSEPFALYDGSENYTAQEYMELFIEFNGISSAEVKNSDGLTFCEYNRTLPSTGEVYTYFAYVYKAEDAFWLVQFATADKNADANREDIAEFAKSVEVTN